MKSDGGRKTQPIRTQSSTATSMGDKMRKEKKRQVRKNSRGKVDARMGERHVRGRSKEGEIFNPFSAKTSKTGKRKLPYGWRLAD